MAHRKEEVIPRGRREPPAFTLVELLVSMAILTIMILIIGKIIADSTRAADISYAQAFDDSNARAAIDTIMDELNQLVVSDKWAITKGSKAPTYDDIDPDFDADDIIFYAFLGPEESTDLNFLSTLRKVRYRVRDSDSDGIYELRRVIVPRDVNPDDTKTHPALDHVAQFYVAFFDREGRELTGTIEETPEFIDIYLMVISDDVHNRVIQMKDAGAANADLKKYILKNGRRHYLRAFSNVVNGRGLRKIGNREQDLDYETN